MPARGGITEYHSPGDHITMTAGAAVTGGNLVMLNSNRQVIVATAAALSVLGVALHDAANGEKVTVATDGVWPLKATGAIAAGDQVIAAATGTVSALVASATAGATAADINTAANNARAVVGKALEAIAGAATGRVKLNL